MTRTTASHTTTETRILAQLLAPSETATQDETAERILDAALEQFLLVGLRRTTIEDVARRAGVGRVTVYRRIGQKHELVEAVILREVRHVIDQVAGQIAGLPSPEERLVEGFVVGLRALRAHPLLDRLLETEPEDLLPYLTLDAGEGLAIGRRFVAQQIGAGVTDSVQDGELVAEIVTRLAQSLVLTPDGGIPLDDEHRLREFAQAFLLPLLTR